MTKLCTRVFVPVLFMTAAFFCTAIETIGQSRNFDIQQARAAFTAAAAEHFEILGGELAGLESEKRPGAYWLVKVNPKKPGHYAVKFTYKYNDPFYDEGENVLYVRVGGKICDRQASPEAGIARFCLGDTVILPVRAGNRYDYKFEIKYTFEEPEKYTPKPGKAPADPGAAKISNPLESYLRYLGTRRAEMPHRNVGRSTVVYSAIFEAVKPGSFNIGVSLAGKTGSAGVVAVSKAWSSPVIILEPGTPITYLAGKEDTIDYSDNRRFSSHGGGTFPTNLLVLQPGDVIELPFLTTLEDERPVKASTGTKKEEEDLAGHYKPEVHKLQFQLNRDWSYNAFIADYFLHGK
jgi:hypothetical protein